MQRRGSRNIITNNNSPLTISSGGQSILCGCAAVTHLDKSSLHSRRQSNSKFSSLHKTEFITAKNFTACLEVWMTPEEEEAPLPGGIEPCAAPRDPHSILRGRRVVSQIQPTEQCWNRQQGKTIRNSSGNTAQPHLR